MTITVLCTKRRPKRTKRNKQKKQKRFGNKKRFADRRKNEETVN